MEVLPRWGKREEFVSSFEKIVYTQYAKLRMRERRISKADVELVLRNGEGRSGENADWVVEAGRYRIVIVEAGSTAGVLTVIRRKGRR